MDGEVVKLINRSRIEPSRGAAGARTQVYGACATVSNVANASGGIGNGKGHIIIRDTK